MASPDRLAPESSTQALHTIGADVALTQARGTLVLLATIPRPAREAARYVRHAIEALQSAEAHLLAKGRG